jgi:hypothetical protein
MTYNVDGTDGHKEDLESAFYAKLAVEIFRANLDDQISKMAEGKVSRVNFALSCTMLYFLQGGTRNNSPTNENFPGTDFYNDTAFSGLETYASTSNTLVISKLRVTDDFFEAFKAMLDDPESGIFNLDTGEDNFSSEQAAKGAD